MENKAMYKTYGPLLYGTILRFTSDATIAGQILERSILSILRQFKEHPDSTSRPFTRMMRITLTECADTLFVARSLILVVMMPSLKVSPMP